ncbi:hypothetical protein NC652_034656 [Populus alba x Populus x berolinensis]|nr:hypothetical protein NC652_034656 [Populus alba x Populus x berolinensis]
MILNFYLLYFLLDNRASVQNWSG